MDVALRQLVRSRAGEVCEYCRILQRLYEYPFHVEHIVARQHGGPSVSENLALSCDRCNLHKGTNLSAVDPETGTTVPLFHPRREHWETHFQFQGAAIVGMTPVGRATAALLQMNSARRLQIREAMIRRGWIPRV